MRMFTGLIPLFWAWLLTNGRGPKGSRPLVRAQPKKVGLKQFIAQNYNDRLHKALESILGPLNWNVWKKTAILISLVNSWNSREITQ